MNANIDEKEFIKNTVYHIWQISSRMIILYSLFSILYYQILFKNYWYILYIFFLIFKSIFKVILEFTEHPPIAQISLVFGDVGTAVTSKFFLTSILCSYTETIVAHYRKILFWYCPLYSYGHCIHTMLWNCGTLHLSGIQTYFSLANFYPYLSFYKIFRTYYSTFHITYKKWMLKFKFLNINISKWKGMRKYEAANCYEHEYKARCPRTTNSTHCPLETTSRGNKSVCVWIRTNSPQRK